METKDYLKQIAEELHTSVMATVDKDGHPCNRYHGLGRFGPVFPYSQRQKSV